MMYPCYFCHRPVEPVRDPSEQSYHCKSCLIRAENDCLYKFHIIFNSGTFIPRTSYLYFVFQKELIQIQYWYKDNLQGSSFDRSICTDTTVQKRIHDLLFDNEPFLTIPHAPLPKPEELHDYLSFLLALS